MSYSQRVKKHLAKDIKNHETVTLDSLIKWLKGNDLNSPCPEWSYALYANLISHVYGKGYTLNKAGKAATSKG